MIYAIVLIVIGVIFHNWFTFLPISSGDLSFFYKEQILQYNNLPFMWETFRNLGFGGDSFIHQGVYFYNLPMGILGRYLDYGVIERIIWFYPILLGGFFSTIFFGKTLKILPSQFYPLITFIYLLNTYFLLIMGGGQLTVVFGYLLIPLIFAVFMRTIKLNTLYEIMVFGLLFSFLIACDFRYAYIFLTLIFLYGFFCCFFLRSFSDIVQLVKKYCTILIVTIPIVLLTQAYWILPYIPNYYNPTTSVGSAYTSVNAVSYLSFAKLEDTISLLHPLWPENIFGKVGFMKPEFFLLPILAFSSLFFVLKKRKLEKENTFIHSRNQLILFFTCIALIGAFLAKGANPPFGELYLWMFAHIPGFVMFRDPTKWYTFVALSYAILISFSISSIYSWLVYQPNLQILNFKFQISSKHRIVNYQNIFLLLIFIYFLFLLKPVIKGEFGGTLNTVTVPKEYTVFKDFLKTQNNFSRVLWIPTTQRFTFYSDIHPAIPGKDFFNHYEKYGVIVQMQKNKTELLLQESGVKYVVIPDDTQKEIYIDDRKYDPKEYTKTAAAIKKIPWLHLIGSFGKVLVFQLDNVKNHFWSQDSNIQINTRSINPTAYKLEIKNAHPGQTIIFSEYYDRNWYLNDGENVVKSTEYQKKFNSFILQKGGIYEASVYYKPQELVVSGMIISVVSLVVILCLLVYSNFQKKT